MTEQDLQKVRSYDDLTAKQVVRYRFNSEHKWDLAILDYVSQSVLESCIEESNSITLSAIFPPGISGDYVRNFGPVDPKKPLGKGLFRLEDTDMELVPREKVRGYRVSYSDEVL